MQLHNKPKGKYVMKTQTDKQNKVKLICMSFDGDYVTEGEFPSVQDAWNHDADLGSRWFFYPFHFVTTTSGKTIRDVPCTYMSHLNGLRVKAVAKHFAQVAKTPEALNADSEAYAFLV